MKNIIWLNATIGPYDADEIIHRSTGEILIPVNRVTWVTSGDDFVHEVMGNGLPDIIYIGSDVYGSMCLVDCAKWLVEYCHLKDVPLPEIFKYSGHHETDKCMEIFTTHRNKWVAGKISAFMSIIDKFKLTKQQSNTTLKLIDRLPNYIINLSRLSFQLATDNLFQLKYKSNLGSILYISVDQSGEIIFEAGGAVIVRNHITPKISKDKWINTVLLNLENS